ncbi:MAG: hypothetical protein GXO43_05820 [Crenarchaeota archaeon]|nr:hypothetical protein [Thermoproteota archaeon]
MVDRLFVYGVMVNIMSLVALVMIYVGARFFHGRRFRDYLPVLALMFSTSYLLYEVPVLSWSLPGAIPLLEDIGIYTVLVLGFVTTYLVKPSYRVTQAVKILYPTVLAAILAIRNTTYYVDRGGTPPILFYLIGATILSIYLWRSSLGHYLLAGAFYTEWIADYRELDNIIRSWSLPGYLIHMKLWTPWIALVMKPDILRRGKKSIVFLVIVTLAANLVDYYQAPLTNTCLSPLFYHHMCWLLCPLTIRAVIYPVILCVRREKRF